MIPLRAGFGHRYGRRASICSATRATSLRTRRHGAGRARVAAETFSERIAPGTKAVSLRIHGSDGPPKVIVRGPDGTTITSPTTERGKQRKGRYLLAENKTDGTTSVLLVKPAAGTWTVKAAPGAESTPTRVDRSSFEAPATFVGQVRRTGRRRVSSRWPTRCPGARRCSLVERGRKGVARTLVRTVRGKPCRGARTLPGGRKLLCARVKFRPSRGPGGVRRSRRS